MPDPPAPTVAESAEAVSRVPEAVIQDVWVRGRFRQRGLRTTDGEAVRVDHLGTLNRDSGPDVADVRVTIGDIGWAGDVEVHRHSLQWEHHGHHEDPAYNRVVLHVVLSADRRTGTLRRADGSVLPELVLLPHLDVPLRDLVRRFHLDPARLPPCADHIDRAPADLVRDWVRHLGHERLHDRTRTIGASYGQRPDLDRLLMARVFRALGYSANAEPMEALALRLPDGWRSLGAEELHAALLRQSGLATTADLFRTDGPAPPGALSPLAWRRGGRPANAPRVRIAQAAALIGRGGPLHHDGLATAADRLRAGPDALVEWLRPRPPGETARLGATRARRVVSDAVLPVLWLYAEQEGSGRLEDAILRAYDALPTASDRIIDAFRSAGLGAQSAREAQGLHQLARRYCDEGRCARCAIGRVLFPSLGR